MKKILAFFSAAVFLGSTTLAVSACGVPKGQKIDIVVKDAPEKAKDDQDPLTNYVYNDNYTYSSINANYLIALAANLASDKIYDSKQPGSEWQDFYSSQVWQYGNFSSFHYEPTGAEKAFSFSGKEGDFVYQIKDNDASEDKNKVKVYWFITSAQAGQDPSKNNIAIPDPDDFENNNEIKTQTGWVRLFLTIGSFKITFDAKINFNFVRTSDKNDNKIVLLDATTFTKPFGDIDFNHPPYDEKIANLKLS